MDRQSAILHKRIHELLAEEQQRNPVTYNEAIPYQRYDRIDFVGNRWTPEKRITDYGIDKYVFPGSVVLDVGCNTGFIGVELAYAYKAGMVHGVEPNSWLCRVGELVAEHLGVADRTRFSDCRFDELSEDIRYDVILSLAAFYTADGREREGAENYFRRCHDLLKKGGVIICESVSFNEKQKGPDYLQAKSAIRMMNRLFDPLEHVIKPSGHEDWFREYFIGAKRE